MSKNFSTQVNIVGIGPGDPSLLTEEALTVIRGSDVLIGAARMAENFARTGAKVVDVAASLDKIAAYIRENPEVGVITVLVSGDSGFYSLATPLWAGLQEDYDVRIYCGISSLQYFCSKLKMPWPEIKVVSLHGRDQDLIGAVGSHPFTFVLTGGTVRVQDVCRLLCQNRWGDLTVHAGERLSYPEERIVSDKAARLAEGDFDSLAVLLIENPAARPRYGGGIPDEEFIRGQVPMTKEEVRSISVHKLRLTAGHTVWDIGAGTGSVAIECALQVGGGGGTVYAIERDQIGIELIQQNALRFGLTNVVPVCGEAPDRLEDLPKPDRVFIGGSGGNLAEIVEAVLKKSPHVRMVINAITLETAAEAVRLLEGLEAEDVELVQVMIAKGKRAGASHMMIGQNPIYVISAGRGH